MIQFKTKLVLHLHNICLFWDYIIDTLQGDPGYGNPLDKAHNEFYDKGFKSRSTHLV